LDRVASGDLQAPLPCPEMKLPKAPQTQLDWANPTRNRPDSALIFGDVILVRTKSALEQ
jgi:hypothetical protein